MGDLNISISGRYDVTGLPRILHGSVHGRNVRGQDGSIEGRSSHGVRIHTPKKALLHGVERSCCTDGSSTCHSGHRLFLLLLLLLLLLRLGHSTDCRNTRDLVVISSSRALMLLRL